MTVAQSLLEAADSGNGADPWAISPGGVLLPSGEVAEGLDVVIHGSRLTAVVPRGEHDVTSDRVLTALDSSLIPGLIDSHVHLTFSGDSYVVENILREGVPAQLARAAGNAQRALVRGVTTAVDCGGQTEVVVALRDGISAGLIHGPRLLVSGAPITTTAGHCHWLGGTADSSDDVIQRARALVAAGVDVIKVMLTGGNITSGSNPTRLQFPFAVIKALAEECDRLGKPLIVHAHSSEAVELAASAGARIIAHATFLDRSGSVVPNDLTIKTLADAGTFIDPTLMVGTAYELFDASAASKRRHEQRLAMIPVFQQMHEAGVRLLAGTDAGVPGVSHGSVAGSIVALHTEVGMSAADALRSGTSLAAQALGIADDMGEIRAGLVADLVLLDGRLQQDIETLLRPAAVWKSGRLVACKGHVTVR